MGPDSLITFFQVILTLAVSAIGVEMANNPPATATKKWFYRASFIGIGLTICGLTVWQSVRLEHGQEVTRQQQHEAEQRQYAMELRTEGENRQLQGQLAAITQFEAQFISARPTNSASGSSLNRALSVIRAAEPKAHRTQGIDALRSMTNAQLESAALNLSKRMRQFEQQEFEQLARSGSTVVLPLKEDEASKKIYTDNQAVYDSTFLGDATAMRDELWRRLERISGVDMRPEANAMTAFTSQPMFGEHRATTFMARELIENHPITDGAAYLEKLARQLSQ